MKIRLISISEPKIDGVEDAKDIIAYTARVSNPTNQLNTETAPKLIKYLANHKHWSPFEMAYIVMEIETTRDIAHQILRHRSFSFQEFSQRYAVAEAFISNREARLQDKKNRQNSIEIKEFEGYRTPSLQERWEQKQKQVVAAADEAYNWALENGIAKECARVVLPEGLTITNLYMAGTIRSWIHYCQVRTEKGVQKEHREIALECWKILIEQIPDIQHLIGED